MVYRELSSVYSDFSRTLNKSSNIVIDLNAVILPKRINRFRSDIIESAFLKAFKAWEVFAEASFVLYMCGKASPSGKSAFRYALPPSRASAAEWVQPERRNYATWSDVDLLMTRSKRFFKEGKPFCPALQTSGTPLTEAVKIRNAIAHQSEAAQNKFEGLIRSKLGTYTPGTTPGVFLNMLNPSAPIAKRFFDEYVSSLQNLADLIMQL